MSFTDSWKQMGKILERDKKTYIGEMFLHYALGIEKEDIQKFGVEDREAYSLVQKALLEGVGEGYETFLRGANTFLSHSRKELEQLVKNPDMAYALLIDLHNNSSIDNVSPVLARICRILHVNK